MPVVSTLGAMSSRGFGFGSKLKDPVVSYLVVGGGGGGGGYSGQCNLGGGGGGGGGGVKTGTNLQLTSNTTYTITVGAKGTGAKRRINCCSVTYFSPTNGGNSSISGTGLSTITATGGGYGAGNTGLTVYTAAATGGTGGGGTGIVGYTAGAAGTAGNGCAGGNGARCTNQKLGGGGGGGAGGAGQNVVFGAGTQNACLVGGRGGYGVSSSITGSAVYYGCGGGGGVYGYANRCCGVPFGTRGTGGYGGGGTGGGGNSGACNAATGYGGGGGGGGIVYSGTPQPTNGDGKAGIVVISACRVATTITGTYTFACVTGKKVYSFTGNGTIRW